MNAVVCDTQLKADTYSATIDGKLGYPKDGVDVGGGFHVPKAQSRTIRHANVLKHPTLASWAYLDDQIGTATNTALPVGAVIQALDATWFPP